MRKNIYNLMKVFSSFVLIHHGHALAHVVDIFLFDLTKQLIEKIYIHPKSENWYKKLVIELVSKLGFDFEIEKSN